MKNFSKEETRKPFTNRQVIDIKSRHDQSGRHLKTNGEFGYESGIWSKFVGLMKNSLNISILNRPSNQLNKVMDNTSSKNHLKEIIMKKNTEKFNDKSAKLGIGLREQKEVNIGIKSKGEKSPVSPKSTKISPSLSPVVSFPYSISSPSSSSSSSFSSPSSLNENIGISFAEQILNFNSSEYSKVINCQAPVTPTTLDGSSTTTSPTFTNLRFSSPSNNNGSAKYNETPNSKEIDSSTLKEEYFSNKKNHAVDFSADDNHLNYIMERINQSGLVESNDKSAVKLDIPLLNQYISQDLIAEVGSCLEENNKRISSNKYTLLGRGLNNLPKHSSTVSYSPSSLSSGKNDKVCYTWKEAKQLISKLKSSTKLYKFNGVPFSDWAHEKIPTLGASPTSCRVQEMFKSRIYLEKNNNEVYTTLFIKKIPRNIWSKQWEMHEIWDGDYVTDGEDFVMEAAALAFLQNHSVGIAPRLYAILEHCEVHFNDVNSNKESKIQYRNIANRNACDYLLSKDTTHIILVSEHYGEDLLDYLDKCEKKNRNLTDKEKKELQYKLALALNNLHLKGLCHLDFTPENILIGPNGINICDFAKSTPIITKNPRHTHYSRKSPKNHLSENFNSNNTSFNFINPPPEAYCEFESCEPTVGKGAYMPPECWKIFWRLEENKIQFPLEELMDIDTYNRRSNYSYFNEFSRIHNKSPIKCQDRSMFYFNTRIADIYMLGIIMFWIWSDGGIWKYSDTRQDHRYQNLVFSDINFDVFRECRGWNKQLKSLLKKMLEPDPNKRITMSEILSDPWWKCPLDE
ncbi:Serine/threonine protein kinase [Cryptosporidium hominis]|uniref:non-specific serine/threonine protein kinase n=1 Tax=Cryptosporidium hominis TaxID=237895 RepID=A0ABX5BG45_CRYHO|nr:Serine/threonine protein kinase [Cryptosporidium hominis]|eukprot:PPS96699.1 Serine/threonine protein kinase [Cryptosporidium hominis]